MLRLFICLITILGSLTVSAKDYQVVDTFGRHWFKEVPKRVVVTDWTLLQNLIELGITPVGAPEIEQYKRFAVVPKLPDSISDIGLRRAPSFKKIQALKPDIIILGTGQKKLAVPLSRIAKVVYYKSFSSHYRTNGKKSRQIFSLMSDLFQKSEFGKDKLKQMDDFFVEEKQKIKQKYDGKPPKVTLIRFSDENKPLVYGHNSMADHMLTHLGLSSDFEIRKNNWGEQLISIEELSQIEEGYLAVIKPVDDDFLANNKAWQNLELVKDNKVFYLPTNWTYGGALSIKPLAKSLSEQLLKD